MRIITNTFAVSPQIAVTDVPGIAAEGYTTLICNRPDGEESGQPTAASIDAAAKSAGITFMHIPIASGNFTAAAVDAMRAHLEKDTEKTFAYCRSGTRSVTLWAMAQAARGKQAQDIISAAARGGYDLTQYAPLLEKLAAQKSAH